MHQGLKPQHLLERLAQGGASQQQNPVDTVAGGFGVLPQAPAKIGANLCLGHLQHA